MFSNSQRRAWLGALILVVMGFCATPAGALPGERVSTIVKRLDHRVFKVTGSIGEMSGLPFYSAQTRFRGHELIYTFPQAMGGRTYEESVWYKAPHFRFANRDSRAIGALKLVFGSTVAYDMATARRVARTGNFRSSEPNVFFRGKRYGYMATGISLSLYRLKDLAQQISQSKSCARRECGD